MNAQKQLKGSKYLRPGLAFQEREHCSNILKSFPQSQVSLEESPIPRCSAEWNCKAPHVFHTPGTKERLVVWNMGPASKSSLVLRLYVSGILANISYSGTLTRKLLFVEVAHGEGRKMHLNKKLSLSPRLLPISFSLTGAVDSGYDLGASLLLVGKSLGSLWNGFIGQMSCQRSNSNSPSFSSKVSVCFSMKHPAPSKQSQLHWAPHWSGAGSCASPLVAAGVLVSAAALWANTSAAQRGPDAPAAEEARRVTPLGPRDSYRFQFKWLVKWVILSYLRFWIFSQAKGNEGALSNGLLKRNLSLMVWHRKVLWIFGRFQFASSWAPGMFWRQPLLITYSISICLASYMPWELEPSCTKCTANQHRQRLEMFSLRWSETVKILQYPCASLDQLFTS